MTPFAWPWRGRAAGPGGHEPFRFWALSVDDLLARLQASRSGLTTEAAAARLASAGANRLRGPERLSRLATLWRQLASPLLLLLVFAAAASAFSGEWMDAAIVVLIVVASVGIGYSREYSAQTAVARLQANIRSSAVALRNAVETEVPVDGIVPGDVIRLSAGMLVPADALVFDAVDLVVDEATLTGESFPVSKRPSVLPADAELRVRTNSVFLGTSVRSGTAHALVARTGLSTEFGSVAARLVRRQPVTEFDRGLRRFGYLLTVAMLVLVLVVFAVHVMRGRPPVETLLFSVALAVGLSPELLPAILSVNLARGAAAMARDGVVVRRLNAIENLGSMDILCTDKTGTLTEGVVQLEGAYDERGLPSEDVLRYGALNASLEAGIASPLDTAIVAACTADLAGWRKRAEVPFDFSRKRSSVIVDGSHATELVMKGSFRMVLAVCTSLRDGTPLDDDDRARLEALHQQWTSKGIRVLAVAVRVVAPRDAYTRDDECEMAWAGFLTFFDRPKAVAKRAIDDLEALGVSIKMLSGDSGLVAQHVAAMVGLRADRVVTGRELEQLSAPALWSLVNDVDVFAEIEPSQKERIIAALRHTGHVVGFLGDGVNDAPAMHAADTSLSVDTAVDVARETADFVLLRQNLDVIREGIQEGRRTFANTLKYILTTTSANLGNMVSMAIASLVLPFLPLVASQILLNNFISDVPAIGIADDSVDPELVSRPERWNMRFIARFMVEFGLLSSLFDVCTFAALLTIFMAGPDLFRTAWFTESVLSELAIALVVRTRRPWYTSRPGTLLLWLTVGTTLVVLVLSYVPGIGVLGFVPLPAHVMLTMCLIVTAYVLAAEATKRWFYGLT